MTRTVGEVFAILLVSGLIALGNWKYSTRPVPRPRAVSWSEARRLNPVIVDSRAPEEYARGHLPGAHSLQPGAQRYSGEVLDRNRKVAVYGPLRPSGTPWQLAVELMRVRGDEVMVITDPPLFVGPR